MPLENGEIINTVVESKGSSVCAAASRPNSNSQTAVHALQSINPYDCKPASRRRRRVRCKLGERCAARSGLQSVLTQAVKRWL